MTFEWFSAVNGLNLSCKDMTNYRPHSYLKNYSWELTPSEIGCFESHRRIWQIIIERRLKNALIFEDDIYLVPSFLSRVTKIIDSGLEFDLVKLEAVFGTVKVETLKSQIDGIQIRRLMSSVVSSAAYMVSRQGCKSLIARAEEYCDPLDIFITKNWAEERIYQVIPALAAQQYRMKEFQVDGMSDEQDVYKSQRRIIDNQFPPRKMDPLFYRLTKVLRRASRKKIFAKFFRKRFIITVNLLKDI